MQDQVYRAHIDYSSQCRQTLTPSGVIVKGADMTGKKFERLGADPLSLGYECLGRFFPRRDGCYLSVGRI